MHNICNDDYLSPICLPPKDVSFTEKGDNGKFVTVGLGNTQDYFSKYEDIIGETIKNRIQVMDLESILALMTAKVGLFTKHHGQILMDGSLNHGFLVRMWS